MYHVLFVDDDPLVLQTNQSFFQSKGYRVTVTDNAADAMDLAQREEFDCIVLAVLLPNGEDGFEICRRLRRRSRVPILFLTSLTERDFLYRGFASGGDDYLQKPYDLQELYLRVEARIRLYRNRTFRNDILDFPPLRIDLTSRQVRAGGELVKLTGSEFQILALLCSSPDRIFSSDEIYAQVWKQNCVDATHTVQVHMSHLRAKLNGVTPHHNFIQTVWGKGYLFAPISGDSE